MSQHNRARARSIAEARYGFRWHLLIYSIINGGLVALWFFNGAGFPWPIFPILFWGIGLGSHYLSAYGRYPDQWIDRETDKILREEGRK